MAESVAAAVQQGGILRPGDRVGVAISGGADSVALLRLLLELQDDLGIVVCGVHFNHGLRGAESDRDELFVTELLSHHEVEYAVGRGDVTEYARIQGKGLEAAARDLRYAAFRRLLGEEPVAESQAAAPVKAFLPNSGSLRPGWLNRVATAHTRDDQAETVLLRILRGTGVHGLRGILPSLPVQRQKLHEPNLRRSDANSQPAIVRPLLQVSRAEVEAYLRALGQSWREDSSNASPQFTRNRVRHQLLPWLEREFNPEVKQRLADLAEIASAEDEFVGMELADAMRRPAAAVGEAVEAARERKQKATPGTSAGIVQSARLGKNFDTLSCAELNRLPLALQRRLIRAMLEFAGGEPEAVPPSASGKAMDFYQPDFYQVEQVRALAMGESGKSAELSHGWRVVKLRDTLRVERATPNLPMDYEYRLAVPGQIRVAETGTVFVAEIVVTEIVATDPRETTDIRERMAGQSAILNSLAESIHNNNLEKPSKAGWQGGGCLIPLEAAADLVVRNWRPGDRFLRAHGRSPRKLKELLQTKHLPADEKKLWPVILWGDRVVWGRGLPPSAASEQVRGVWPVILVREVAAPEDSGPYGWR